MRWLALLCILLLLAGTLPLYAIAFYNHPYYDDFGFSADVRAVWQATHNPAQVLTTALSSAAAVRQRWQGNYTGTLLSNVQPGVFSEGLYYLTTFILLTAHLLCFGFLLHTVLRRVLRAGRAETAVAVSLFLLITTQFLPDVGEAFYWFNGGIGNVFVYALLALAFALMIRLYIAKRGGVWLAVCLFVLTTALGGGSYGGGLFGLLAYVAATVFAFARKNRARYVFAGLTAWFLACFMYSVLAPGNALRAQVIGASTSAPVAVLKSLYYGIALMGDYFTLPVAGLLLLLAPILYRLAAASGYRFRHPLALLMLGVCMYCAQLTPPLYAGVFLGGGRTMNTYYISYVALLLFFETYLLGAWARRHVQQNQPVLMPTHTLRRGLTLAALCLMFVGCLGYKQPGDVFYGPMNMAGGSAALSILTGEAARYDREMDAREALLNDESQPVVTLAPLSATPRVLMADLLAADALYDVRPTLQRYYNKAEIRLAEGGAQ